MSKLYNVGMYIRLSRENTSYVGEDSLSIENQQAMLSKFIDLMPGWIEKRVYIDNGATGGNFNRQGFQDLMSDAREGIINLVLVQDLSRFGRNYLEAGKYLEEELPSLGCRFVALADGIDTMDGENDIMPFLNAMNDYFLKNLSDRIKTVLTAKAKDGQKLSGAVPYGYDRNPEEHTRLIVDTYAAEIVNRIFEMRSTGMGYGAIAGVLNTENILPPRLYYFTRQNREATRTDCTAIWKDATVKTILKNDLYLGHTTAFKSKSRSHRDNRSVPRDKSEWIRTENTHAPIISTEVWEKVQQINAKAKENTSHYRQPQPSLFHKLLVCSDCKTPMSSTVTIKNYGKGRYESYHCRLYARSGRVACSQRSISEIALKKLVLADIKEQAKLISLNENRILEALQKKLLGLNQNNKRDTTKERKDLERQLKTLDVQMEQCYEDKISGNISAETFAVMASEAESKRTEIMDRLTQFSQTTEQHKNKLHDITCWISLIKEKSTLNEVDRELLESLIEKIEIGEKHVVDGVKTQDVSIYYKYVGLC